MASPQSEEIQAHPFRVNYLGVLLDALFGGLLIFAVSRAVSYSPPALGVFALLALALLVLDFALGQVYTDKRYIMFLLVVPAVVALLYSLLGMQYMPWENHWSYLFALVLLIGVVETLVYMACKNQWVLNLLTKLLGSGQERLMPYENGQLVTPSTMQRIELGRAEEQKTADTARRTMATASRLQREADAVARSTRETTDRPPPSRVTKPSE